MRKTFDKEFKEVIGSYLPNDIEKIRELCIKGNDSYWGKEHIDILAELAGLDEHDPIIDDLRIPYVLFSAHYFLLDAAVDQHLSDPADILFVTHMLFLTQSLIFQAILQRSEKLINNDLYRTIGRRVSENTFAIQKELNRRKSEFEFSEVDYPIIVGRSNSTLLFYEILTLLEGHFPDQEILTLLSDLVFYLQLGDDIGDWEEDLERGNYTPLLQLCFKNLPQGQAHTKQMIEEQLFLKGVYEQYMSLLIKNFDRIGNSFSKLKNIKSKKAQAFIKDARNKAYQLITGVVSRKVSYIHKLEL